MTDDAQRARRRAHNAHALERCNAMGRTAGSILWQPLENRAGKWFMPDGSELAETPVEWRSERLSTILDEMDERQAIAAVADPGKAYVQTLDVEKWKASVDAQFFDGGAVRLDFVETHTPGPDGSPYGWTEIALVKTTVPTKDFEGLAILKKEGAIYPDSLDGRDQNPDGSIKPRPSSTISLEELEKAISGPTERLIASFDQRLDTIGARVLDEFGFKNYRRSQIAELRKYIPGEEDSWDIGEVSVSVEDVKAGSPKPGDMIARNPKNHADQWLVAEQYFKDNFEPI